MKIILKKFKWIGFSAISLLFFLPACSTSHRAIDSTSTVIPKHLYAKEMKPELQEGAIWPGDTSGNLLFEDSKARKVGDIVTVTINETATSSQSATTNTAKNTSVNMQAPSILGLPSSLGVQNFLGLGTQFDPTVSASVANSNQGNGTVTRNGTLTGTISALITEIIPSGNFRIEGRRSVTVNSEEQIMVLRGVIRPQDINFDNTISSIWIADASISLTGEGVVADEQRKGWLAKVFSKVWPF
ncbi:MAG: flagellar basal body L-ring protein FlgH [Nitrospina sp.]|jgi:flagellar L-ring protein FlgH|nr:flagellar basal body L-ring protein FlgH [Nitrospina sp.]MBT3875611.1 flagellar basal body L-ring protein FlgH [Nitrospina sp.]MBT4047576.1 flagellar basal body L-ring protein FlgH [Nitrospina sp.]MBT4556220.1 flagellar basal body L-ring protein FlgH [Nitrospina sp.]MBT5348597.1 flagellar basal body L-ring protein FlgH [Nitrospina sp.]